MADQPPEPPAGRGRALLLALQKKRAGTQSTAQSQICLSYKTFKKLVLFQMPPQLKPQLPLLLQGQELQHRPLRREQVMQLRTIIPGFFAPILRFREQQNFRNLEFRREILEFSKKSFHFHGGNLEFPLSLEEKS